MAKMIPASGPREHTAASKEGRIFNSLSLLPDDYYVVHSLDSIVKREGKFAERELDFVVFHPQKGILCIEAKAGAVSCQGGTWRYGSGQLMSREGPYRQVRTAMYHLMNCFDEIGLGRLLDCCKFVSAVWFVDLRRSDFAHMSLPLDARVENTLFFDDLRDPEQSIERIFALKVNGKETSLTEGEAQSIVTRVLCPEFSIVPTTRLQYDLADVTFARLLDSQTRVLDFIRDQRFAVINGAAGTGKTLIAMERARRAADGGQVLFLCYNAMLRDDIAKKLSDVPNIEVRTVASYACKVCKTSQPDYYALGERLMGFLETDGFPYDHVIIDEGQDFGVAAIEEASILDTLLELVRSKDGTFYLFYDRRQFVQGSEMPRFINEADCKLTLYVNCRNTQGIARCSLRALGDTKEAEVLEGAKTSGPPQLFASEDRAAQVAYIDEQIDAFAKNGLSRVVILTCKAEHASAFGQYVKKGVWKNTGVEFTTCRKFKGLEADAVILVDVDEGAWRPPALAYDPDPGLVFYTGSSRAKHELRIVCDMGESGCLAALSLLGVTAKKKPISRLAKQLGAVNVSR